MFDTPTHFAIASSVSSIVSLWGLLENVGQHFPDKFFIGLVRIHFHAVSPSPLASIARSCRSINRCRSASVTTGPDEARAVALTSILLALPR
jgi:hypothetical protein